MTRTMTLPAPDEVALSPETTATACLDVDLEARILSCDAMARRFLELHPRYCRRDEAERLHIDPAAAFDAALWIASRQVAPDSTVLLPEVPASNGPVQINVLPFQPERVRIVVFWHNPDATFVSEQIPSLTARERAVLELAAAGLRRDRIGHQLNISLPTVDLHCRNLRRKLSALTMSEAVAVAARRNILSI
ncbi:helix-turn-helix transcriptional regulator [Celeribacter neptunius]|uniref:Regulatory protein, luxR family n=1 Tax=Celeribacter neptunius TaxID=588602 RepID=A0A1I3JXL0_9RHOB|nr:helix-turn-helix transcriptional regulator [Celeribacter neptunius]SFI64914.1 regulatory protein, luxR family [Celeribacter neptunius]